MKDRGSHHIRQIQRQAKSKQARRLAHHAPTHNRQPIHQAARVHEQQLPEPAHTQRPMRHMQGSSLRRIRAAGQRAGGCDGPRDDSARHRHSARSRSARRLRRPRRVDAAHRPAGMRKRHQRRPAGAAALSLPHEHAMSQRHGTGAGAAHGESATGNTAAQRADTAVGSAARLGREHHQQHVDRESDEGRPSALAHQ